MNPQLTKLNNGLRVVTMEMPESQSVAVSVMVGVGSRHEQFEVNGGVSHFLEHLLFKGTTKRPNPSQISSEIDAVGGYNNAYTSNELTSFYIKVPKQHAVLALDILADMIQNPLFDPTEVDHERGVILEEMSMIQDDYEQHVGNLVTPLIWPRDPMRHPVIGSESVIRSITPAAIAKYQRAHYTADNIVVAVAGNITHEAVVEQVERQMGGLMKRRSQRATSLSGGLSTKRTNGLSRDTNQAHFIIGAQAYPTDHSDDAASDIVAAILGRGMSSRLVIKIREELGLAYAVQSTTNSFTDTGIFEVYAGVNVEGAVDAITAVMAELARIRRYKVDKSELLKAKNQLRGAELMERENNAHMSDQLGIEMLTLGRVVPLDEWLRRIDAVTIDDVKRVAEQMLDPSRLRLAVIAPDPEPLEAAFEKLVRR